MLAQEPVIRQSLRTAFRHWDRLRVYKWKKPYIVIVFLHKHYIYIYIVYSCPDQACEAEVDLLENTNHMYTQELVTLLGLVNSIGWKW